MTTFKVLIKSHRLVAYYLLVFVISWGFTLLAIGPRAFLGLQAIHATAMPLVYVAALAGPSVGGVVLTALVHGGAGLRDLGSRLARWRLGGRWWAVALLTAPLVITVILLGLSSFSRTLLPAFLTASNFGRFSWSVSWPGSRWDSSRSWDGRGSRYRSSAGDMASCRRGSSWGSFGGCGTSRCSRAALACPVGSLRHWSSSAALGAIVPILNVAREDDNRASIVTARNRADATRRAAQEVLCAPNSKARGLLRVHNPST